jgi:6-pyruvoyltetrahydropterin/6-carboxytetrahydropterin synthase
VIDANDPMKDELLLLETKGLAQITQLDGVGAERFAYHAWSFADKLVREMTDNRCWCESAECMEHGANSAVYMPHVTQKLSFVE